MREYDRVASAVSPYAQADALAHLSDNAQLSSGDGISGENPVRDRMCDEGSTYASAVPRAQTEDEPGDRALDPRAVHESEGDGRHQDRPQAHVPIGNVEKRVRNEATQQEASEGELLDERCRE